MKYIAILIIFAISPFRLASQEAKWSYDIIDEEFGIVNYFYPAIKTSGGGYIVIGHTFSINEKDINFIQIEKLNEFGIKQWKTKVYSDSLNNIIYSHDIVETQTGGFKVLCTKSNVAYQSVFLVEIDCCGNQIKTIDIRDKEAIFAIFYQNLFFIPYDEIVFFYIKENKYLAMRKYSGDVNFQNEIIIDSAKGDDRRISTFLIDDDFANGFNVNYTISRNNNEIVYRYKAIDNIGNTLAETEFQDDGFTFYKCKKTKINNYVTCRKKAYILGESGRDLIEIIKYDREFKQIWKQQYGEFKNDECRDFSELSNNNILFMIEKSKIEENIRELQALKINYSGDSLFSYVFEGKENTAEPRVLSKASENEIIFSCSMYDTSKKKSKYFNRFICFVDSPSSVPRETVTQCELNVYPNPATEYIELEFGDAARKNGCVCEPIEIYDLLGRRVANADPAAALRKRVSVANLPSGVYFVRAGAASKAFVKIE